MEHTRDYAIVQEASCPKIGLLDGWLVGVMDCDGCYCWSALACQLGENLDLIP